MIGHVIRARVTQIINLNLLAPDIQEDLLFLPRVERGRDPIRELISIVTPRSFNAWIQRRTPIARKPTRPGRPRTPDQIREVVLRIARETGWGYTRILGELRKLGVRRIGRTTVRTILLENGLDPQPERKVICVKVSSQDADSRGHVVPAAAVASYVLCSDTI